MHAFSQIEHPGLGFMPRQEIKNLMCEHFCNDGRSNGIESESFLVCLICICNCAQSLACAATQGRINHAITIQ